MAQVTLYIDDETMKRLKSAAESAGKSMSAWLVDLVRERTRADWPAEVQALAGAWRDMPDAESLRSSQPDDAPRETL